MQSTIIAGSAIWRLAAVRRALRKLPVVTDAEHRAPRAVGAGLCDSCEHQQLVANTRGSTFSLCRLSREDSRYARYPRIPVLECAGHRRATASAERG